MANKSHKGVYWTQKHEDLCVQWITANTRQEYEIYNKLHPPIYRMQEIIIHRYFSCPPARYLETMHECCNHVFLQLRAFKPERNHKAYSYVQTVIKNFCLDKLVLHRNYESRVMYQDANKVELDNPDFTEEGIDLHDVLIVPEMDTEVDVDELRQKAIAVLQKDLETIREALNRLRIEMRMTRGRQRKARKIWLTRSTGRIKQREYLKLAIKFFNRHKSVHINHNSLNDYIIENSITLYPSTVANFTSGYVGVVGSGHGHGKTISKRNGEYGSNADKIGMPYFMDDLTPKEYTLRAKKQKIYREQSEYLYF